MAFRTHPKMIFTSRTAITLAGAAVLGLLAVGQAPEAVLQAASPSSQPLVDTDGDGLHDLLEIRLGTRFDEADTDADGASDLEEYLSRRDPLVPNGPLDALLEEPAVRLNVYEVNGTTYVQFFASYEQQVSAASVGFGTEFAERWLSAPRVLGMAVERQNRLASSDPQVNIVSATIPVDAVQLKALTPLSLGFIALIDGQYVGDEVPLVEASNEVQELRALDVQNPTPAENSPLGLFPAQPQPQPQRDGNTNEVCVQSLQIVGGLAGGKLLYSVGEAYCDYMPTAVCVADCRLTAGGTVVGLDIPGLLSGLAN